MVDFARLGGDDLSAGDAVIGTQAKPACEVAGGGEGREVAATLGEQGLDRVNLDARDGGEIGTENPVELGAEVEAEGLAAAPRGRR